MRIPADSQQIQAEWTVKGLFTKGHQGNPAGGLRGMRNHATILAEQLMPATGLSIPADVIERREGVDEPPRRRDEGGPICRARAYWGASDGSLTDGRCRRYRL